MARRVGIAVVAAFAVAGTIAFAVCGAATTRRGVVLTYKPGVPGEDALQKCLDIERRRLDPIRFDPSIIKRDGRLVIQVLFGNIDQRADLKAIIERTGSLTLQKVDTEHPVTERWVERVREQRPAGIEAKETPIRPINGAPFVERYLLARTKNELSAYLATLALDKLDVPADRELQYGKTTTHRGGGTTDERWRTYLLERDPWITAAGITKARPIQEPDSNRWQVEVELDNMSGARFGDLSSANVGHKVAIVLDGEVVSDPIIEGAIRGGRIAIALGSEMDPEQMHLEAIGLADTLGAGALPGPLTLESERDFEVEVDGVRWNVLAVLGMVLVAAAIAIMGWRWRR